MIPLHPRWPDVLERLACALSPSRRGALGRICDRLASEGVAVDESTLRALRNGRTKAPEWHIGAALLNLTER